MNDFGMDEELGRRLKQESDEVPQLIRMRVDQTLAALPKKRRVMRKIGYTVLAACVAFSCFIVTGLVNPEIAKAVRGLPVIGSVFELLGDTGIRQAGEGGLSSRSSAYVESQGITMTITEVLYDGVLLSIGYVIEGGGDLRPERPDLYVNGKSINFSSGARGQEVEDSIYAGLVSYKPSEELPDQFTLKLEYNKMRDWSNKVDASPAIVKGNWTFEIPVKKLTEAIYTKAFTDNHAPQVQSRDTSLKAHQLTFSPALTSVEVDLIEPVELAAMPFRENLFQVVDDRGVILQYLGATSSSRSNDGDKLSLTKYRLEYAPVDQIPDYLIVRPYVRIHAENNTAPVYHRTALGELPITLSQGAVGSVTISQIEFHNDDTSIYYSVQGSSPYEQASSMWIEDETGTRHRGTTPQLVKAEPDQYSFVTKLPPIDKQTRLTLLTMEMSAPQIDKQLEFKIPVR